MRFLSRGGRYRNTASLRIGGLRLARPPKGPHAAAWEHLRATMPKLDGARVSVDLGDHLQVEIERTMGSPVDRYRLVVATAGKLGTQIRSLAYDDDTRQSYWTVAAIAGVTVIVSTVLCECHAPEHVADGSVR